MEIYIIKVNLSLILFYLCYKLLFQRDTFWMLRRVYLLVSILFSFIYPLVSVEGWIRKQEPIMTAIANIQMDEFVITANQTDKLSFFTLGNVLWTMFGFVALLMLLRFFIQLFAIIKRRIQGEKIILQNVPVIRLREKLMPFSFFRWIFINPFLHNQTETSEILEHELTHVRQWHSLDIVISQVQTILCWFNPAAWLLAREIRINLEFLADNQVIKSGFEPKKYQYHLLSLTYEPADSKLGNQFNVSPIKKRIKMMNAKRTKKRGLLKYALIIPIALVMLVVSNVQEMIAATKTFVEKVVVTENMAELGLNIDIQEQDNKVKFTDPVITRDEDIKVFEVVEQPPSFTGGDMELYKWLSQNIVYPVEAQSEGIQGRVFLQFVITETGKVIQAKVVRGADPLLDAEALRVVNTMPNWIPGKQGGKAVNTRYTLPIDFKLADSEQKNTSVEEVWIKVNDDSSNIMVDTPPIFPGGDENLFEYLSNSIKYPLEAQQKKISGRVIVSFVVTETGKITQPRVLRSVAPSLDAEAIRVVSAMPDWIPGKHKGKNASVSYTLPINFRLPDNEQKEISMRDVKIEVNPTGNTVIDQELIQPAFPGGEQAMWRWLSQNMVYPVAAFEVGAEGHITVQFIVDENGKPTNLKIHESKLKQDEKGLVVVGYGSDNKPITRKATSEEIEKGKKALENEAIRVVSAMPNFTPGKIDGKATKMQVLIPIMFKLQ